LAFRSKPKTDGRLDWNCVLPLPAEPNSAHEKPYLGAVLACHPISHILSLLYLVSVNRTVARPHECPVLRIAYISHTIV